MKPFEQAQFNQALSRAVGHFNAKRWQDAEREARAALRFAPSDPSAINIIAAIAMQSGRAKEAVALFERAVAGQPQNPFLQFNLGEAYRRTNRLPDALACFDRAGAMKPDFAEAFSSAGEALRGLGREGEAERRYQAALQLAPQLPSALHGYGLLNLRRGASEEAERQFSAGLKVVSAEHPLASGFLSNLGVARLQLGDGGGGLEALSRAVELAPASSEVWQLLAGALRNTRVIPTHESFWDILLKLFARDDVNPRSLATAALAALSQDAEVGALLRQIEERPAETAHIVAMHAPGVSRLASDPLFLTLLSAAPIPSVAIELLMVHWRAKLLTSINEPSPEATALAIGLARQAFLNEYVYFVTPEENALVDDLSGQLDRPDLGSQADDILRSALFAAYRPLRQALFKEQLTVARLPELADLVREQLIEPEREATERAGLPTLKPVTDPISLAVQEQYEESPFPRWTRSTKGTPLPFATALRTALPHLLESDLPDIRQPRVLIAGCGTGQETMQVVNTFKDPNILAVDLSRTSLGYAVRKMREYGLTNVSHLQADILDLAALTERFDLIHSFGVLHHMADPAAGLAVLTNLLAEDGFLFVGLYSEIGRQAVVNARAYIAAQGYTPTPDGIRRLRRDFMQETRPPGLDLVLSPGSDFWTMSDCRDLVFHVNEHRFTLLEVQELLIGAGLEFLGLQFGYAPDRSRFLAEHSEPGALKDLTALHDYEVAHPETFGDTYRIWGRRIRVAYG